MDEDSQQLPESPRDSQQLPESPPPPIQKHATNVHASPSPSSRTPISSFESIAASGANCIPQILKITNFLTIILFVL